MLDKPSQKQHMLRLNAVDNVAVAITTVEKGVLTSEDVVASERIGKGHKMAASPIKAAASLGLLSTALRKCFSANP